MFIGVHLSLALVFVQGGSCQPPDLKLIGTKASCERSSRRVWSANVTTPHCSLVQSMASPIARTSKVMENDPSLAKGTVRPLAYPGGFDDTHSETGDEPSMLTPPTQRRESVQAA